MIEQIVDGVVEQTQFARADPGLMRLALFRPLPRKGREQARKKMFEITVQHEGRILKLVGAYTLGADDLSILLAIIALCAVAASPLPGSSAKKIKIGHSETARVDIKDGLESEGEVENAVHIRLRTTLNAICREAGIAVNKQAYVRVNQSLSRLRSTHYDDLGYVGQNSKSTHMSGKQNLLSAMTREDTKEISIVLNARFSQVIFGGHHIRIDLNQSRSLGEMARILHARLTALVRPTETRSYRIDELVEAVYGEPAESTRERLDRRVHVKEGLTELSKLEGWRIAENRFKSEIVVERFKLENATLQTCSAGGDKGSRSSSHPDGIHPQGIPKTPQTLSTPFDL